MLDYAEVRQEHHRDQQESRGFTDDERTAMKERAQELKAEARRGTRASKCKADGESDVLAKIAETQGPDRAIAVISSRFRWFGGVVA